MDKLPRTRFLKGCKKSFAGSLQIWKWKKPRHQMFLFYIIIIEGGTIINYVKGHADTLAFEGAGG